MDTLITEWLAHSPQHATDAGEELACLDQWLNQGLIDVGAEVGEDEIARSLEEFTGQEFFSDSPPPCADHDAQNAPVQQLSASSQPTSSGDGQTSSGGVCGGGSGAASNGMGLLSRGIRSFSTNDLQYLMEQQAQMLPPVTGLSAPPHGFSSNLSFLGAKPRTRPSALESVPEGAPSPAGPVQTRHPPAAAAGAAAAPVNVDSGTGANSPALGTSPGAGSALILSRSAPAPGLIAPAVPVFDAPTASAGAAASPADVGFHQQKVLAPESGNGGSSGGSSGGGGLRHVPSTGTLSTLMSSTLTFQPEGTDESSLQLAPTSSAPAAAAAFQQLPQETPGGQLLSEAAPGASAAQVQAVQGAALGSALPPPGVAAAVDYGSGAATAAAAAAATGVFPLGMVASPGAAPALAQHFTLSAHPGLYGIAPHVYSAAAFPANPYPLAMALAPLPSGLISGPAVAAAEDGSGAAGAAGAAAGIAAAAAAAAAAGPSGDSQAPSGPRLRKSQSALELCSWRSTSWELAPDIAEASASGGVTGQKLIGRLTPEERLQRILRYRNKRNQRNFNREIKYMCRKTLADSRPRVGGRFARNDDPNSVMPHQTKKAMRRKGPGGSGGGAGGEGEAAAAAPAVKSEQHQLPPAPPQHLRPQQAPVQAVAAAQPSSSSTTTTSLSSDNHRGTAACASSSGAAVPLVSSGGAATSQPTQPSAFAPIAGLPFTYAALPGVYAASQGLVPPGGVVGFTQVAGVPPPPGILPPGVGVGAAQLQHHLAVVNAAAQAAAQGVYAHLGVAPATASVQQALHGALHAPALAGAGGGGAAFLSTGGVPQGPAVSGSSPAAAAASVPQVKNEGVVGSAAEGQAAGQVPPGVQMPSAAPRMGAPLPNALWTQFGEAMAVQAAAAAAAAGVNATAGGATCMTVDG